MNDRHRLTVLACALGPLLGGPWARSELMAQARAVPTGHPYTVRAYTVEDGLPFSEIRRIAQTADGHLLIASGPELVRYDGYEFHPVPLEGFESSYVLWFARDRSERLWVVNELYELGFFDPRGDFHALPRPPSRVLGITETRDGRLWLGTEQGLFRVVPESAEPYRLVGTASGLPADTVAGLVELPSGERLVVSKWGLYRDRAETITGEPRYVPLEPDVRLPTGNATLHNLVHIGSSGVWLATADGALRYDGETVTPFRSNEGGTAVGWDDFPRTSRGQLIFRTMAAVIEAPPAAEAVAMGPLHMILDASDGSRIFIEYPAANRATIIARERRGEVERLRLSESLTFRSFNDLLEDREGNVWIAANRGLLQLSPRRVFELDPDVSLPEPFTTAIRQTSDGTLWVGTWGGGLVSFADGRPTGGLTVDDGLVDNRIRAVYEDVNGTLWVASGLGIAAVRGEVVGRASGNWPRAFAETVTSSGEPVLAVAFHRDLRFIPLDAAPIGELTTYDPFPEVDMGDQLWALHADSAGGLWVGGNGGLFYARGDSVRRFGPEHGLIGDTFVSIHELSDGSLWVSSYQNGLYRIDGQRFSRLTSSNGLPADGVWAMVEDGLGGVWMSSDRGIARVGLDRLHAVADSIADGLHGAHDLAPMRFTESEGMRIRESNRASPAGWRLTDGTIVFNSVDGLAVIDPERATRPVPTPNTAIQEVLADGVSAGPMTGESLDLPVGTRHVTFAFAALSFATPSQRRYRYRLDGFDDDWIEEGSTPRASYTGLAPGSYTFRVQGASAGTGWGEEARYSVVLPGFFWQSTWFRFAVVLAVLGAGGLAYRARVGHLLAMERLRLRIASDLHDDVGSNLSSISLLTEMLEDRSELGGLERRQLERIGAAASETIGSLREIIWLVDPNHGRLPDLIGRMRTVAEQMLESIPHTFTLHDRLPETPLEMPWMRSVLLAFKESLHNVVKHSAATRVDVDVSLDGEVLTIEVRDDGSGFDPGEIRRGHGRENMRRRLEGVRGSLAIATTPGAGTTVRMKARI